MGESRRPKFGVLFLGPAWALAAACTRYFEPTPEPLGPGVSYDVEVLKRAARDGDYETVRLLLERGVAPNAIGTDGFSALVDAQNSSNPRKALVLQQFQPFLAQPSGLKK